MINNLLKEIRTNGDRGAVVPFSRAEYLKKDMLELRNGDYRTDWIGRMVKHMTVDENKFIPGDLSFSPHSLIAIVMPSPKVILHFNYHGKIIPCVIPPHYTNWYQNNERALRYLDDYLTPLGFSVAMTMTITQKLLAVHCGLARYGRNNICYNEEFGSYMQIMTYVSDFPCEDASWFPLRRMDTCSECSACVDSCPTGAIDIDRRLINSDRCITYVDELPNIEFPEWLDNEAHNSLVGCTKCQDCCPGNAHNKNNIVIGVSFTEEETAELINNKGDAQYSDSLSEKIEASGIPPEYSQLGVLPRNLAMLLRK